MSVFQGDFLGFQLGDEHSYRLNITRVSVNDRYQDQLIPSFTDSTVQVPGGDGTYYFDTSYNSKPITISFAFDDLRDEDLRSLRQMFSFKTVKPLIFDEFPYKKYMVKCSAPPQLNYLCFDEYEFRIYKGEGTVQLIAYYPFAFAVVSPYLSYKDNGCVINNTGDLPANLKITYELAQINSDIELSLREKPDGENITYLKLSGIEKLGDEDVYLMIDTQTQLIEGLNNKHKKTGNLYNRFIDSGDFFWPPCGRSYLLSSQKFKKATYTPLYF